MENTFMVPILADISKVLVGGALSLLPFWLNRRCKLKSEKLALHIELKNIQDKSNAILKLIHSDSLLDNALYKEFNQINASFKTPVIDKCYDKIDLLPNPDEPEPKYDHCFTSWIKKQSQQSLYRKGFAQVMKNILPKTRPTLRISD